MKLLLKSFFLVLVLVMPALASAATFYVRRVRRAAPTVPTEPMPIRVFHHLPESDVRNPWLARSHGRSPRPSLAWENRRHAELAARVYRVACG